MKQIQKLAGFIVVCFLFVSCKKDNKPSPSPTPTAKCIISGETTSLAGNESSTTYTFDATGNPTEIKIFNRYGGLSSTCTLGSNTKVVNSTSRYSGKPVKLVTEYLTSDVFTGRPAKAFVSIDDGDTMRVHYWTYFFFYDSKDRLYKVGEQTDYVRGDREYDLNIFYNDADNVTGLQYEWTTGPREVIPPITVTAYDDKPTPYAGIKNWPLLNINFGWDNYDSEPILTALSKNNPLDYRFGSGSNQWKRTMTYTYNDNGFPTQRTNTNKNENGEYTFIQTFTYTCK